MSGPWVEIDFSLTIGGPAYAVESRLAWCFEEDCPSWCSLIGVGSMFFDISSSWSGLGGNVVIPGEGDLVIVSVLGVLGLVAVGS